MYVLVVCPCEEDREQVQDLFAGSNWMVRACSTCEQAPELVETAKVPVVIVDGDSRDAGWRALVEICTHLADPAKLIVFSRLADERMWLEVLDLGAHDLLAKPLRAKEMLDSVGRCWLEWKEDFERRHQPKKGKAAVSHSSSRSR